MDTASLEARIRTERTAVLVINQLSRHGCSPCQQAVEAFTRHGFTVCEQHCLDHPSYLRQIIRTAVADGASLIVVGGGDGTISSAVSELVNRDVALGILPLGTGNSFAVSLGIPIAIRDAVDVIAHGKVADVDLGRIEDQYFANMADLGMTVMMAQRTTENLKRRLGRLAYILMGASVLWSHQAFRCHLRTENEELTYQTHEIIIANGRLYGDTVVAREASVDDRVLTIISTTAQDRYALTRFWCRFLHGTHSSLPDIISLAAKEVYIETDPPQIINADGERMIATPAHFAIVPQSLRILVPANDHGT